MWLLNDYYRHAPTFNKTCVVYYYFYFITKRCGRYAAEYISAAGNMEMGACRVVAARAFGCGCRILAFRGCGSALAGDVGAASVYHGDAHAQRGSGS